MKSIVFGLCMVGAVSAGIAAAMNEESLNELIKKKDLAGVQKALLMAKQAMQPGEFIKLINKKDKAFFGAMYTPLETVLAVGIWSGKNNTQKDREILLKIARLLLDNGANPNVEILKHRTREDKMGVGDVELYKEFYKLVTDFGRDNRGNMRNAFISIIVRNDGVALKNWISFNEENEKFAVNFLHDNGNTVWGAKMLRCCSRDYDLTHRIMGLIDRSSVNSGSKSLKDILNTPDEMGKVPLYYVINNLVRHSDDGYYLVPPNWERVNDIVGLYIDHGAKAESYKAVSSELLSMQTFYRIPRSLECLVNRENFEKFDKMIDGSQLFGNFPEVLERKKAIWALNIAFYDAILRLDPGTIKRILNSKVFSSDIAFNEPNSKRVIELKEDISYQELRKQQDLSHFVNYTDFNEGGARITALQLLIIFAMSVNLEGQNELQDRIVEIAKVLIEKGAYTNIASFINLTSETEGWYNPELREKLSVMLGKLEGETTSGHFAEKRELDIEDLGINNDDLKETKVVSGVPERASEQEKSLSQNNNDVSDSVQISSAPKGLKNPGTNVCYANSVVQLLFASREIMDFLSQNHNTDLASNLFDAYKAYNEGTPSLMDWYVPMIQLCGQDFQSEINAQQDAASFLRSLLLAIFSSGRSPSVANEAINPVIINEETVITCSGEEAHTTSKHNADTMLTLTASTDGDDLQNMINTYQAEAPADKDRSCSKCNAKGGKIKRNIGTSDIVFVQVANRFQINSVSDEINRNAAAINIQSTVTINDARYAVVGIINRFGVVANSGHYVALVQRDGQWYECNDDSVTSRGDIFSQAGVYRDENGEAYVIMLKKIQ